MNLPDERKNIYRRLLAGYLGIALLILLALAFSLAQGAGWKPLIGGLPAYVSLFIVVTYYFIKDIRRQRRRERGEPEPPPKKSYWEQD